MKASLLYLLLFAAVLPVFGQAVSAGGSGNDKGFGITADDGSVYVVGSFGDTATFGSGQSTRISLGNQDGFLARYTEEGVLEWVSSQGGILNQLARDVAVSDQGGVYITGEFQGDMFLDSLQVSPGTDFACFLARYDTDGEAQWGVGAGGTFSSGTAVATDPSGNVFVTGNFLGDITLEGDSLESAGDQDFFLAKFDADGNLLWSRKAGSLQEDGVTDLAADDAGNVYMTGYFRGALTWDAIAMTSSGTTNPDAFFMKISGDGEGIWGRKMGSNGTEIGWGIDVDDQGLVHCAGTFSSTIFIDSVMRVTSGSSDLFVFWVDTGNVFAGLTNFGSPGPDLLNHLAAEDGGATYLSVSIDDVTDFDNIQIDPNLGGEKLVVRLSPAKETDWIKQSSGIIFGDALNLASAGGGRVFMTGGFKETANIGGSFLDAAGDWDIFIAGFERTTSTPTTPITTGPVKLYPNPAQDRVTLDVSSWKGTEYSWELRDLQGRLVRQAAGRAEKQSIDVAELPAGAYLIRVWSSTSSWNSMFIRSK